MRILLVEDSDKLCALVVAGLAKEGFIAEPAKSVSEAISSLATTNFSAMILDLGLPDGDGLSVLKFARARGIAIPVLILTARGTIKERVQGLQNGADDYLIKPFAFEELVARLRALLRRPETFLGERLSLGMLSFDAGACEIYVDGKAYVLTRRESTVLELLLRRNGKVVPKKILEDQLYGLSEDGSPNAVEVCVHRLRKQLMELNAGLEIHTIRGVGYLINEAAA